MGKIKAVARVAKFVWLGLTLLVLLRTILVYQQEPYSEVIMLCDMLMNILCFPMSIIISLAVLLSNKVYFWRPGSGAGRIMLTWAVHFFGGYFQWFVLLPLLLTKLDRCKTRRDEGTSYITPVKKKVAKQ
jgi:hypothetical protein